MLLVHRIPDCSEVTKVKPVPPTSRTSNEAHRYPLASCHFWATALTPGPATNSAISRRRNARLMMGILPLPVGFSYRFALEKRRTGITSGPSRNYESDSLLLRFVELSRRARRDHVRASRRACHCVVCAG